MIVTQTNRVGIRISPPSTVHLYKVGDAVAFSPPAGGYVKTDFDFTVCAQLPPLGDVLQYRIKSSSEPYERVVVENQLTRILALGGAPADVSALGAVRD